MAVPEPRVDRASGFVPAPPETVYRAFVEPEALMAWLPPAGMTGRIVLFEPREGGRYRIALAYRDEGKGKTDASTDVSEGRFLVLEPGRRIVMSVLFDSADPAFAGEMIMTWSFAPAPGGTEVAVAARQVPAGIAPEDHAAGMASSLANLAKLLA